ncbi:hypothetical protein E8E11_002683 [Didymella keratinophila]|nr:hypothetical protein E8E11_002683 [Didymella keratinophila]
MTTASFSCLPHDILIETFTQLKRISDITQAITSCSLVNHRWHEAATPLLYGNIALTHNNLARFCEHPHVKNIAAHIHSIAVEDLEQVSLLVPLLPRFCNLRSFSFWLGKGSHNIIPQSILVKLVEALPSSCVNLELDTSGDDVRAEGDASHLCDSLRRVLPRMQHVRLRIRSCEAFIADPLTPDQTIHLPHLKSFIYSCMRSGRPLPTCRNTQKSPITHRHPSLLWSSITASLSTLISTPNTIPADAQVLAFMTTDRNDIDLSLWPAHIRADIRSHTSLALPHRAVWMESTIRGSHVLRLPEGAEVMGTPAELEAVAEGQLWREVRGGARLPAAALSDARAGRASFAVGCVEKPMAYLKSSELWREENPRKKIRTWINEESLGMRLVGAEIRSGEEFLSLEMVEITPAGWRRVGINDVLEKIEV